MVYLENPKDSAQNYLVKRDVTPDLSQTTKKWYQKLSEIIKLW